MAQLIQAHWEVITMAFATGFVYVVVAMVSAMPENRAEFTWYDWFYHWTHICLNMLPAKYKVAVPTAIQPAQAGEQETTK